MVKRKAEKRPKSPEPSPAPVRLVIIDDQLDDWRLVLEGLPWRTAPFELLASFKSMFLALPLLERGGVDAVLLGAGLPWLEGRPCSRFLHRRWPNLAIVVIGGKGSEGERQMAILANGCPCLFYPILAEQLMKAMHKSIREAGLRNTSSADQLAAANAGTQQDLSEVGNIGGYTLEEWKEIARKAKFHPAAVAKLMGRTLRDVELHSKAKFGLTPREWMNNERMRLAVELLQTHLEIKEIADRLGFQQLSHFSRMFKEYHQFPPRAFRARLHPKPEEERYALE